MNIEQQSCRKWLGNNTHVHTTYTHRPQGRGREGKKKKKQVNRVRLYLVYFIIIKRLNFRIVSSARVRFDSLNNLNFTFFSLQLFVAIRFHVWQTKIVYYVSALCTFVFMDGVCRQQNMQFQTWNRIAERHRNTVPMHTVTANELQFDSIIRVITHSPTHNRIYAYTYDIATPFTMLGSLIHLLHGKPFSDNLFIFIKQLCVVRLSGKSV